eukprot:gene753-2524_t
MRMTESLSGTNPAPCSFSDPRHLSRLPREWVECLHRLDFDHARKLALGVPPPCAPASLVSFVQAAADLGISRVAPHTVVESAVSIHQPLTTSMSPKKQHEAILPASRHARLATTGLCQKAMACNPHHPIACVAPPQVSRMVGLLRAMCAAVPGGGEVVDFGCGAGYLCNVLSLQCGVPTTGLERQQDLLDKASTRSNFLGPVVPPCPSASRSCVWATDNNTAPAPE